MKPKQARYRLDGLWRRGMECLGTRYAIMGGAMTWVSERHLVAALSNGGGGDHRRTRRSGRGRSSRQGNDRGGRMTEPSTYIHRRVTHLTAFGFSQARSAARRDGGPSQGPRDESVRTRKAARRVAFSGHRRAYAPLDDVQTLASAKPPAEPGSPARRLLPGGREKTIICRTLL